MGYYIIWDIIILLILWDIREIFDTKDGGAANFKKIVRV